MYISRIADLSRRTFLQRATALTAVGAAAPLAINLAAAGEAAAYNAIDYKALVCVFLTGGNDYANTVVPYDTANYDLYSKIRGGAAGRKRGGIAYGRDELSGTVLRPLAPQVLNDDMQYALSPKLSDLARLFNSGKAAVQLNVGSLIAPTTLAQYNNSNRISYPLPPKLFSHNDQQAFWQSLDAEGSKSGWGGRMADLAMSSNGTSGLTCISASGNAVFVSGNTAMQYQLGTTGAISVTGTSGKLFGSTYAAGALSTLITKSSSNILENDYSNVTNRSIAFQNVVNSAIAPVALNTEFPSTNLASQLKVIARLIGARTSLGMRRQVFFVSMGGFDTHDGLMEDHPDLMAQLNSALTSFYDATIELGISDKVTTFTASDFGRTLASNGNGTDHGWGGHQFIVGGAVKGGQFYGKAPHVSLSTDDQVGQGRLLPSTSVTEMGATLARWFGVSESEMNSVFPNSGNFSGKNLGFLI